MRSLVIPNSSFTIPFALIWGGNNQAPFKGFHEILPGLGAFVVSPDENGVAQGLESLTQLLDEVLAHLGNRTTAQERVSYADKRFLPLKTSKHRDILARQAGTFTPSSKWSRNLLLPTSAGMDPSSKR